MDADTPGSVLACCRTADREEAVRLPDIHDGVMGDFPIPHGPFGRRIAEQDGRPDGEVLKPVSGDCEVSASVVRSDAVDSGIANRRAAKPEPRHVPETKNAGELAGLI